MDSSKCIVYLLLFLSNGYFLMSALEYVAKDNFKYLLYARPYTTNPVEIKFEDNDSLHKSGFSLIKPVKILKHGWKSNGEDELNIVMKDAFLQAVDANVIVIDWSKGMNSSANNMYEKCATQMCALITWLTDQGVPWGNIHVIGHSLGAHIAGMGLRECRDKGTIPYFTALDPPDRQGSVHCINPNDAAYVEVIHTFTSGGMQILPVGHADFYPNGGAKMPGCAEDADYWCSHRRAYWYFAESLIDDGSLWGDRCSDYEEIKVGECAKLGRARLGGLQPKNSFGVYYLETNPQKPFNIG